MIFDGVTEKYVDCRNPNIQRSLVQCQKTLMQCFPADESDFDSDLYKYMYRSLCAPMLCNGKEVAPQDTYSPITTTAVVLPVVVVIVVFLIIVLFMYKKFSSPKDDLRVFSKLD
ncbi:hypothetical protein WA588_002528 [Blastocystis sp. NMH]